MQTKSISFDELVGIVRQRGSERRSITAIGGPPASGKSTVSARLAEALNADDPESAAVFEMDGYHFDDWVLVPLGLRPRKGAPETFDVAGFASMLGRLHANEEAEIAVPVFDRSIEIARAGARLIPKTVRHLIVEGNYLLMSGEPWEMLNPFFDTTVALRPDVDVLRTRLVARWEGYGLEPSEVMAKVEGNDLPNARMVLEKSRPAEFELA